MAQVEMFSGMPATAAPADAQVEDECYPTPALRRVLEKAHQHGVVRRAGIYSDTPQQESADLPEFDWQATIDRAIERGWLAPGVAFNTYALTAAGSAALAAPPPRRVAVGNLVKG
jgi:hypothetical protein